MADWTDEQKRIFAQNSGNVLVSASAGSGKTTVMVKKVVDKIVASVSVNEILVLSYTNASAADMRAKIVAKLFEEIKDGTKSPAEVDLLRLQLDNLPFSDIGTMDSFCGRLLRENFEVLGISPSMEQMDQTEADELKRRVMTALTAKLYAEEDVGFLQVVSKMPGIVDDVSLSEIVLRLYDAASINPSPEVFLAELKRGAAGDGKFAKIILEYYRAQAKELTPVAEKILSRYDFTGAAGYFAKVETCIANLKAIAAIDEVKDVRAALLGLAEYPRSSGRGFDKEGAAAVGDISKKCKDIAKELNNKLNADYAGYNVGEVETFIKGVTKIVERFGVDYNEYKRERGKLDFNDLSRLAIRLLSDDDRAKEVAARYSCIFVDEYQDINPLQESILNKLARDNVFMVGDVKQSIYAFRNADCEIFEYKEREYERNRALGTALPMTESFRSTKNILQFVDDVFSAIMSASHGGVDYSEKSRFIRPAMKRKPPVGANVEVRLFYPSEGERTAQDFMGVYSVLSHDFSSDECFNPKYREGREIAKIIKGLIGRAYVDGETVRKIEYGDVALLFRKRSKGASYVLKALSDEGVPFVSDGFVSDAGKNFKKQLITTLKALDNSRDDISFTGYLLSFFGGLDEKVLAEVIKAYKKEGDDEAVVDQIERCAAADGKHSDVCKKALDFIKKWRRESAYICVAELLNRIIYDTGFDAYVLSRPQGLAELSAVNGFIGGISATDAGKSLQAYLAYYAAAVDKSDGLPPAEFDNAVRISTVHGSKGLEYPTVILPCVDESPYAGGGKDEIVFDKTLGMGVKLYNEEERLKTPSKAYDAIRITADCREAEENIRLLYVALTRAKSFLFVTGSVKDGESVSKKLLVPKPLSECRNFLDLLINAGSKDGALGAKIAAADEYTPVETVKKDADCVTFRKGAEPYVSEISRVVNFEYGYAAATKVGLKYTVSALNRDAEEDTVYIPTVVSEDDVNRKTGIAYHAVMENLDFNLTTKSEVDMLIAELAERGVISKEEAELVDGAKIFACINSKLIREGVKGRYLRERPFMLKKRASEVFDTTATDEILIQGTADLILFGDENIVVDFKYSTLSDDALAQKYEKQLNLYETAVESAFGVKITKKLLYSFTSGNFITVN